MIDRDRPRPAITDHEIMNDHDQIDRTNRTVRTKTWIFEILAKKKKITRAFIKFLTKKPEITSRIWQGGGIGAFFLARGKT